MTDIAQKKDYIKKNIRSLLLSSPAALTLDELKRDYHSFMGERIDFRFMGYVSLEGFLRDIGDAVSISYRNGMMTLKANADESTAHIQRLVSKQKVPNKRKYAVYRQRGGSGPPRKFQAPESNRFPPRRNNNYEMVPPPAVVPYFIRRQMEDLLRSFSDGISVMQLDKAFQRRFGTSLNYRNYGFMNQYEFLKSMGEILSVEEVDRGEWYVLPVGYKRRSKEPVVMETPRVTPTPEPTVQPARERPVNSLSKQTRPSKGRGRRRQQSGGSDGMTDHETRSPGANNSHDEENILERNIQMVLEKHPKGLWASSFSQEFLATHGKPIVYKNLGHLSVIDLVASMPHIVSITRPNPQGDWMLYDVRNAPEIVSTKSRSRQNSGKAVETETKEAIQYILNSHPNGVNVKDFPNLFKECTGKDLPYEELGFNLAEDLFVSLADSDLQISYTGSGMAMFPMNAEIPDLTEMVLERISNNKNEMEGYPQDVVGPGCHFVPVMLPDEKEYIELYVTNIISPSLFWIMLRHKTKSLALEELMDRLDDVYKYDSDKYKMPESLMVPGQVCAALFPEDNNWHRTVITGSNDEGFIQLYYVDYGNTNFVTKSSLRFLKTDFLTLPAQAVQARLANTQPPGGGKWKNKSRNRLLELTSHKALVGYVCAVKNQNMSICLTDTNHPDVDVHINDIMVSEGLAEFEPDPEVNTDNAAPVHAMEPDYGQVFGWKKTEVPRLPKVSQGDSDSVYKSEENEYKNTRCYVKWIQLTDNYIIHLISLDRVAYILSAEISILFWEEDILASMLKQRRVDIQKFIVCRDEYPELFDDLKNYNVPSLTSSGIVDRKFVSLYKLENLPRILRIFEHEDEGLLKTVDELVNKFDPDSPYWKSGEQTTKHDVSEEKTDMENDDTNDLSLEEKQTALQTLQFKRKRILQTMISNPDLLTDDMVNELNNIEIEIVMIKQQIKDQQTAGKTDSQSGTQSTPPEIVKQETSPQMSENQRVIQNIMDSSTKPIATANIMTQAPVSTINQPTQVSQSGTHIGMMSSSWTPQSTTGCYPGMMNQSMTEGFPDMSPMMAGNFQNMATQSAANFPGMMTQSMMQQSTGSFPGMMPQSAGSFPGMMPQSAGSFPGMMGVPNPRLMNPVLMNQAGLPCTGMGDLTNTMFPRGMGFGAGLNPNFQAGLLPQFNPLMMQCQNIDNTNLPGMPRVPLMPNVGRGQTLAPGILPGLLPLVQNLNLGRGSGT